MTQSTGWRALFASLSRRPVGIILSLLLTFILVSAGSLPFSAAARASDNALRARKNFNSQGSELARLSTQATILSAGRGAPYIGLGNGHSLETSYAGPADLVAAMAGNQASPLALASGDFDEDGTPDLVIGYSGRAGGILSLLRGNVDSVYPDSTAARLRKASGQFTSAPFLSPATLVAVPDSPDFIVVGDFDSDGHLDIVTASSGDDWLNFLSGNGTGEFRPPRRIQLPGPVTALYAGDFDLLDGRSDIAVGIQSANGPVLDIFSGYKGSIDSIPETVSLPDAASSIASGSFTGGDFAEIAVAAGKSLVLLGPKSPRSRTEETSRHRVISTRSFPHNIRAIASGHFTDRSAPDLALVGNGRIRVLQAETSARTKAFLRWKTAFRMATPLSSEIQIATGRVSTYKGDSLLISDSGQSALDVVNPAAANITAKNNSGRSAQVLTTLQTADGAPVAAIPMRLNSDALADLVVVQKGSSEPSVITTQAQNVFVVGVTADSGPGSLRQAIIDANNAAGSSEIDFLIPVSGVPTIHLQSRLPAITKNLNLNGSSQSPGLAGIGLRRSTGTELIEPSIATDIRRAIIQPQANGLVELDGGNIVTPAFNVSADASRVSGFIINRCGDGITVNNPACIIEGNALGTDATGTVGVGNSGAGVFVNSFSNIIGSTSAASVNLISANSNGVVITGPSATNNQVILNLIGSNAGATLPIPNQQDGVIISAGASRNSVGGTIAGTGNLIAASGLDGVEVVSGTGNLIGRNQILLNGRNGVSLDTANNTVGGVFAAAANGIWSNGNDGLDIAGTAAQSNMVQGNLVGINFGPGGSPIDLHNNLNGISVLNGASNNLIGGPDQTVGNGIAANRGNGITVSVGTGNAILSNGIFSNSNLDIDLENGGNRQLGAPSLKSAVAGGQRASSIAAQATTDLTVSMSFTGEPNQSYTMQFFFGGDCDCRAPQCLGVLPSLLGTETAMTDASGNFSGSFTFSFNIPPTGGFVNATATASDDSTSQYSQCIQVSAAGCAITCPGDIAVAPTSASGAIVNYPLPSLTQCGAATPVCSPASGSLFPIGTTAVTCTITGPGGFQQSCSFNVTVTNGPIINSVVRAGKHLQIIGSKFDPTSVVLSNGAPWPKTKFKNANLLIAKKLFKKTPSGTTIIIQVKAGDGTLSNSVPFSKP